MKKYAAGDYVDDEVDLEETAGFGRAAVAEAAKRPTYAQQKAKPKNRIVTKEELAKSGLSLRDFLNKERGLTRRDGKAPAKAEGKTASGMSREARGVKATPAKAPAKIEKPGFFRRTVAALGGVKLPQSQYGSEPEEKKTPRSKPVSTAGAIASKNVGGMAKGGKVRKSCDGIAKRGKTKGKMC
jgi:hypothetical protein